ncbi:hypothetical protein RE6C_01520 [Rhodopirellula europaea 6C]|uniref:Uncharacterized protein n=1 Tax=Rhodopirellula europaea 6C TaxID=1263867 RepID=M2B7P8_9BACT|nr:hypothetical protein RE6C_01520 [Rhodopirellula europaea 6C]
MLIARDITALLTRVGFGEETTWRLSNPAVLTAEKGKSKMR